MLQETEDSGERPVVSAFQTVELGNQGYIEMTQVDM